MRERVIDLIRSSGLTRIADDLVALLQDSLRLETAPLITEPEIGSSRIGGAPDMPPGFAWPEWKGETLSFTAQLNMAEVSAHFAESALPSTGMLYFFYAAAEQPWGFDPKHRGSCKVMYYDGAPNLLKSAMLPKAIPQEGRFAGCSVEFHRDISLPSWDSRLIEPLDLTEEEAELYMGLEEELAQLQEASECIHRLLGHPNQIQGDMQMECQLVSNGLYCGDQSSYQDPRSRILETGTSEWCLLLQMDSDDNAGMMWGDAGRIYFWVKQDDLKNRAFENTWPILQCY